MRKAFSIIISFTFISLLLISCGHEGCMDPYAKNFDERATVDDGSCKYKVGCTDVRAKNWDPEARVSDPDACIYSNSKKKGTVTFFFDHTVGSNSLKTDTFLYLNEAGNKFSITRLEYIVTNVRLKDVDGKIYTLPVSHYRNAREKNTRSFVVKNVPSLQYNQIGFVFGINAERNKTGELPDTATYNGMLWAEDNGGGYAYMKLEGRYIDTANVKVPYKFHLGHVKDGSGKVQDNSFEVGLAGTGIVIDEDKWEVQVFMDVEQWFENPHTIDFNDVTNVVDITKNQDLQGKFRENGQTVFTVGNIRKVE